MNIPVRLIVFFAVCIVMASIVLLPRPSQIGQALELSGRLGDAVAYYQKALQDDPEDEVTRVRLGGVYQLRGEPDYAGETYQYLIALNPDDVGYHRLLAELEEWNLRIHQSMAQKGKIAALDRRDIAVRADLADYEILEHKDYAAAIRYTEEAVAARPQDMQLLLELAQLYAQAKRIPESIAMYERAIEEDATDPAAQRGLAKSKAWDEQAKAAIAQGEAALAQNPGDRTTAQRLRDLMVSAGRDAEVRELDQRFPGLTAP
jgi:tetratricopeptide (TPR) repeat protein